MNEKLPSAYSTFTQTYPQVWEADDRLGAAVHRHSPLDEKSRELVKLGIAIGVGSKGAVHSHTRQALAASATHEEIRHVVLLAIPTIGFPSTMVALT